MTERGILFSPTLVARILSGRKTVTRRIARRIDRPCPLGGPGDVLWVREAWQAPAAFDNLAPSRLELRTPIKYSDGTERGTADAWGRKRVSMHLPRQFSRIDLEIVDVRLERVRAITPEGVVAEGLDVDPKFPRHAVNAFAELWNVINADRGPVEDRRRFSWKRNPHVWRVAFKRIRP